jgi:predicted DNA-binding transcriptional regulator AlpA|nr:helix-turn-helix domain-containing protein [uncultured Acetatifactor sp.]
MNTTKKQDRLTLRVEECADLLGICRSAAYNLVRQAESSKGKPFQVIRIGNSLLISKKSFQEFLETNGLM